MAFISTRISIWLWERPLRRRSGIYYHDIHSHYHADTAETNELSIHHSYFAHNDGRQPAVAGKVLIDFRIVRIRYILPNKNDFEPCWPVFKKYLKNAKPAATMFVAELLDEKMKIEIEVTARLNE